MTLDEAAKQLAAAADPSRLRLLLLLLRGETTVGDLVSVLGQSQPRVSRHLRVLSDAGLIETFREGRSTLCRWSDAALAAGIASYVNALALHSARGDLERLDDLRRQREKEGLRRALRNGRASEIRPAALSASDSLTESLSTMLGAAAPGEVLVAGAGSGQLVQWLLGRASRVVGIENSRSRRQLARARIRHTGLPAWTIRDAPLGRLPFPEASFDLVLVDAVLQPPSQERVLAEASRVLRNPGRLLVIDRILPAGPVSRSGLDDAALTASLARHGLHVLRRAWLPGRAPDRALFLAVPASQSGRTGTHD